MISVPDSLVGFIRQRRSVSSDQERELRLTVTWRPNRGLTRPLSTPPALQTRAANSPFESSHSDVVKAGYWSWNSNKAEVEFSPKGRDVQDAQSSLTTKSPAQAVTSNRSPAMSFTQPSPSDRSQTPRFGVDLLRSPHLPMLRSDPDTPTSFVPEYRNGSRSLLPPSSPPPLRFGREFTGWLLPDGIDTSIPDDNFDMPDLTDTSNIDLDMSTTSSNASYIPPTPDRGIGLGLSLGFAHTQSPLRANVAYHDGEISETFLNEAICTFNAMSYRERSGAPFFDQNPGYAPVFPFEGRDIDFTPNVHEPSAKKSDMGNRCCSFSSTPLKSTSTPVASSPRSTSPVFRPRQQYGVSNNSGQKSSRLSDRKPDHDHPGDNSAMTTPPNRRSLSLKRRVGRDVTVATISSTLKSTSPSGATSTAIRQQKTSESRVVSKSTERNRPVANDSKKVVVKEVEQSPVANPLFKTDQAGKQRMLPRSRNSMRASNLRSENRMSWR
ncbi:hypothetical protein F5878DRAFT_660244 [Lentinula raphanica]|uniref:Uncharacterized protein n=1 Tax=Lentinula raphanica TaxID=153919 RepID=A0AA38PB56_9AGAR|nr:hypothetical protein F5878DRAFT_660244 [Lentinula raphanica]